MLTKNDLNRALAAILTTLAEVGEAPNGHLYMALQTHDAEVYTHATYIMILGVMLRAELVTEDGDLVELTPKGRQIAGEIEAHLAAARAAG